VRSLAVSSRLKAQRVIQEDLSLAKFLILPVFQIVRSLAVSSRLKAQRVIQEDLILSSFYSKPYYLPRWCGAWLYPRG